MSTDHSGSFQTLLLDRDGVINEDRPDYVLEWRAFRFLPGVLAALARLHAFGLQAILTTNQSCVGRGYLSSEGLEEIHGRMLEEIRKAGGDLAGIYVCPHRPDEGCQCRKPKPGLLNRAIKENGLDRRRVLFVGDTITDLKAARAAGVSFALVKSGKGQETFRQLQDEPGTEQDKVFDDLGACVQWLLSIRT